MPYKDPEKRRECARECNRRWRENHPQQAREQTRNYMRQWRSEHRDEDNERQRIWRAEHPEQTREHNHKGGKKWTQNNPDKHRNRIHRRRALQANTNITLTAVEEREILQAGCFFKDSTCSGPLTIAHNIPVSKGGDTTRANCFCLCKKHNSEMGTKTLWQTIKQLLFIFS